MIKNCDNCKYGGVNADRYTCTRCKNSKLIGSEDWAYAPWLWEPLGEAVSHPPHYNQGKYECIDVMTETFGKESTKNFCLLNAFKYIWRAGDKNGREDIKKAAWYLDKFLELEGETDE